MHPESQLTPQFLRQLELLKLRARRAFLGSRQGGHTSIRRGLGIEFSDYRKYEPGDNVRHIDWGVYARSDRLYVKRFREERNITVYVVLDVSGSMFEPAEDRKWDRAKGLALALSYVALMQQDTVRLITPASGLSPAWHGARGFQQLAQALAEPVPVDHVTCLERLTTHARRVTTPGLALVVSDFLWSPDEAAPLFQRLREKNLEIHAVQVLGANDLDPFPGTDEIELVDSETGERQQVVLDPAARTTYRAKLEEHAIQLEETLNRRGVHLTRFLPRTTLSDFVFGELVHRGLLQ